MLCGIGLPETKAVVMLGGENDTLASRAFDSLDPTVAIKLTISTKRISANTIFITLFRIWPTFIRI